MPPVSPVESQVQAAPAGGKAGWWPLAVIASAHLMAVLDTTVMFVALPSVQRGLGMTVTSRQWVVTAYTLSLAGLLLLGGRLADRFGARNTLLAGVIGFACASAIGGASVDGAMLITARAVQGAFGALLISSTKSLLVNVYTDAETRARAIGIFTATLTAGLAAGLVLGGALTTGLNWRWCLYVNVPLSAVAILGAPRMLPALPGRPEIGIDVASALLATAGMVALIYGLGEASSAGWGSAQVAGSLSAAVVLLGGFTARQIGHTSRLLPLRVVLDRNRGWGMIAMIVNALSTFGMMLILTYQLQSVMRYSALATGLALVPFALAAGLGSAFGAPWLMARVPPRWLLTGSIVIEAAGLLPLIWLTPRSGYLPLIFLATIVEGLGTGLAGPIALATALHGVLPSDTGAAAAATSAAGQLGSSVGAALLNTIAAAATSGYLAAHAGAGAAAGTVHGFAVAMAWGAILLVLAAIPVAIFTNAPAQRARARKARALPEDVDGARHHQGDGHDRDGGLGRHAHLRPARHRHHVGRAECRGVGERQVQVVAERGLPARRSQSRADHLHELEVRVLAVRVRPGHRAAAVELPVPQGEDDDVGEPDDSAGHKQRSGGVAHGALHQPDDEPDHREGVGQAEQEGEDQAQQADGPRLGVDPARVGHHQRH